MPDWTKSMQQTFEYYVVDPGTWRDVSRLTTVKSSTINREDDSETLGSASIDATQSVGECYVRIWLVTIQNGVRERFPLGTFLVQTPSSSFDGKIRTVSMDAYTPLMELKENPPPIGYFIPKDDNIMDSAYMLCRENMRAPVVPAISSETLYSDFVAQTNDTWISYISDLMACAKFKFDLDEMGRVLFAPIQETAALQPVWDFNDDNSSILYPELDMDHDIFDIPNAVEVIYSGTHDIYYAKATNDDINNPLSTVNRGREKLQRITDPDIVGEPTQMQISEYAKQMLKELSTVEYTITYTHAYCPVRVGDCVRLNYKRAGLTNIKARVISQSIKCENGCSVTEKAVFTTKLWEG